MKDDIKKLTPIEKSNAKWLLRDKPSRSQKEMSRINDLLNSKPTRPAEWSGSKYRSVRG